MGAQKSRMGCRWPTDVHIRDELLVLRSKVVVQVAFLFVISIVFKTWVCLSIRTSTIRAGWALFMLLGREMMEVISDQPGF